VPVVSLVKGLEQGTNSRMSQIVDEVLPGHPAGILAGPNIAREVADGYAAAAVLAMPDQHLAARLAELFRTRRFRTYTTDDVVGVEMAGALKNVYAIAVGRGYSLGIGENTRAMVMARAIREMTKMGEAAGGHRDTFAGLAGIGDLIVTCTSQRSRNRHVGEQLGAGKPIDEIIASMNQVAEGVKAASVIMDSPRSTGFPCRSLAKSTASSITAQPRRRVPRVGGRKAWPRGPRGRFLAFEFGRQAAAFLWVPPKGRAKSALSGEASRRPVG
jgi:glycerol-3-phosphate dehydrogenase (NAD(P)+)